MQISIGGRYKLKDKIGSGGFGEVFRAQDSKTGQTIALKMERRSAPTVLLPYETKILEHLQGIQGIPELYNSGVESDFNYMAMEFVGNSVDHFHKFCKGKFDILVTNILTIDCDKASCKRYKDPQGDSPKIHPSS